MNGYVLITVLYIVLPLLNLFFAWKKDRSFVWFFAAFFLPVISTLLLILGPRRKQGELIPPQVCIFILIIVFVLFVRWTEEKFWTEKQATKIIAALENYNKEQHQYPNKLKDLVPRYLPAIPKARLVPGILPGDEYFNNFSYYPDEEFKRPFDKSTMKMFARLYYRVWDIFPSRKIYDLRKKHWHFEL